MLSIDYQNHQIQKIKVINKTGKSSLLNKTYRNSQLSGVVQEVLFRRGEQSGWNPDPDEFEFLIYLCWKV